MWENLVYFILMNWDFSFECGNNGLQIQIHSCHHDKNGMYFTRQIVFTISTPD